MAIYLPLGLHKGRKLQEKPSALKREHPALQNMKILYFFSIFVGHFCPPGSGSGYAIWMRIRIRIQQLKLMRIHADPEPWIKVGRGERGVNV